MSENIILWRIICRFVGCSKGIDSLSSFIWVSGQEIFQSRSFKLQSHADPSGIPSAPTSAEKSLTFHLGFGKLVHQEHFICMWIGLCRLWPDSQNSGIFAQAMSGLLSTQKCWNRSFCLQSCQTSILLSSPVLELWICRSRCNAQGFQLVRRFWTWTRWTWTHFSARRGIR